MEVRVTACDFGSGVLKLKCSWVFGIGSKGNPSAAKITKVIEHWISDHPETLVTGLELDYTDVDYSWGDGPISSLIPFVVRGITKVCFVTSSRNYAALESLFEGCRTVCDFELMRLDTIGGSGVLANVRRWLGIKRCEAAPVAPIPPITQSEAPQVLDAPTLRHIEVLEDAIGDVGRWLSWTDGLPDEFRVQFGGVQLWNPPAVDGGPPSGRVALIFQAPSLVAFITDESMEWVVRPSGVNIQPSARNWDRALKNRSLKTPIGPSTSIALP